MTVSVGGDVALAVASTGRVRVTVGVWVDVAGGKVAVADSVAVGGGGV